MFRLALVLACFGLTMASSSVAFARTCPVDMTGLAGTRDFTTVVAGSKSGGGLGTNGYYRMIVTQDGCDLKAAIVKLGYGTVRFSKDKLQFGSFPVKAYKVDGPGDRVAMSIDASLKSENGSRLEIGFTFVGEMGFWRYLGSSWEDVGFWGPLESAPVWFKGDDNYAAPEQPKCTGSALQINAKSTAGYFYCRELVVTTPDLRKVLWFHPLEAYGAEAIPNLEKVVAHGAVSKKDGVGYVGFCAVRQCDREGCGDGTRSAHVVVTNGKTAAGGESPLDAVRKKCGLPPLRSADDDRWDGTIGSTPTPTPSPGNPFLFQVFDRFCRGTLGDDDYEELAKQAKAGILSSKTLVGIFNIYGAFYSYEFKQETWLNELYYGKGARILPASCRGKIGSYTAAKDVPMQFGKSRDRVKAIWSATKK